MPVIKSLTVGDTGDSSVGINANNWKILFESDLELDDDQVEPFRAEVNAIFDRWNENGFRGRVEFDFEVEKRLADERAENEMLDEASDTGDEMQAQKHNWESDPDFCGCAECERLEKLVDSIFAE